MYRILYEQTVTNELLDRPPPVGEIRVQRSVGVHGGKTPHGESVAKEDEVVVVVGLAHRKEGTAVRFNYGVLFVFIHRSFAPPGALGVIKVRGLN